MEFIKNGLSSVLGVLNGIGGFVSSAYAQTTTENQTINSIDDHGLQFIAEHEVFKSKIYQDVGNKSTIGFGHLIKKGEDGYFIDGIKEDEALKLLNDDVKEAENHAPLFFKNLF